MKVAFNRINLTPKDYLGKPLAGYSRKNPCLGILDNIHAYGVLVSNYDENKNDYDLLLISVDTLKLPLSIIEYIKRLLVSKFRRLNSNYILVHATHTHASFDLTGEFHYPGGALAFMKGVMFGNNKNDKYIVWMGNRIVKMVDKLYNGLKPCKIAWKKEKFNPELVINRRWPIREVAPDLGIISFKSREDNNLIGLIINYACHPTTLSNRNYKLSADFPGRIIYKIDQLTNRKVKTIYFNGPSGNLNPITTSGTEFEKIDKDKSLTYNQLGTYKHTEKFGYIIAEEALKLVNSIPEQEYYVNTELAAFKCKIRIPQKDARYYSKVWFSNKLKWVFKKYFLMKIAKFEKKSTNFPFFTIERKHLKKYARTLVQFINIKTIEGKSCGILTVPGELFEEIGKTFIKESPNLEENTFIFQNCQDWIGYLFSLRIYTEEGGYEPFMCFSPLCGAYVEDGTRKLLKSIK